MPQPEKILSPIKQRIVQFLENQGIKETTFYKQTGITRTNFSNPGGKSELGGDKIVKILTEYPQLSPAWLLLEEGQMLRPSNQEVQPAEKGWEAFCRFLQTQLEETKQKCQHLESIIFHGTPELRNAMINAQGAKRLQALSDKMDAQRKKWESEMSAKAGSE